MSKNAHPTLANTLGSRKVRLTGLAHQLASEVLVAGGYAVDATAGNGQDTLFLARRVGATGHVLSIDIQPLAIATTQTKVIAEDLHRSCDLRVADHAKLAILIPADYRGKVDCVLFNLGYLPGSDHSLTTKPVTTGQALHGALGALRSGGRIICVIYTGHPGGELESETVDAFGVSCEEAGHTVQRFGREIGTGRPWILCVTCKA
jgi:SAM-dependent methyltransferase